MGFFSKLFGMKKSCCKSESSHSGCCGSHAPQPEKKSCCGGGGCHSAHESNELTEEDHAIVRSLDDRILIGKVLEVSAHPDAKITKVKVTKVDVGRSDPLQVLCGGINVSVGQIVAVACVGSELSDDFSIEERDIRGVKSSGMICARSELGISAGNEKKGEIWSLPSQYEASVGKPLRDMVEAQ